MGVDPLAVVFDQQQLRQYLISNLKTGQCVPSSSCHTWSVAWWTPPPPSRPLTHALYLLCSNRKIWTPGTAPLRCCMSNDSSSWHAASLSWPSTMWLFLRQVVASANKDSGQQYVAILPSCACEECAHALSGLRHGGRVGMPCRTSQVVAKFARDSLANFTPTFFRQCVQMHANLPPPPPPPNLFTSSVETATVTLTHARLLAVGLHQSICSLSATGDVRMTVPAGRG